MLEVIKRKLMSYECDSVALLLDDIKRDCAKFTDVMMKFELHLLYAAYVNSDNTQQDMVPIFDWFYKFNEDSVSVPISVEEFRDLVCSHRTYLSYFYKVILFELLKI
jgi:hypothetical protein